MTDKLDAALGPLKHIRAGVLEVAYHDIGERTGPPVVLLHGFPYDVQSYAAVAPLLADCRVIVPYLRGYGPTRFIDSATPRSGEQAAVGADLLALLDALQIPRAILAGYDWGARAACVVAALWPERCAGLVSCGGDGYSIQDIDKANIPNTPENEYKYWYQWYFGTERGRAGLEANRAELCEMLWRQWSPTWSFDNPTYARSARSFDNPDFVDVVIHSYRHRYGLVPGDPAYADIQARLAELPSITVPAVTLEGLDDGVMPVPLGGKAADPAHFTGTRQHHDVPGVGHNFPQEKPQEFAAAVRELLKYM